MRDKIIPFSTLNILAAMMLFAFPCLADEKGLDIMKQVDSQSKTYNTQTSEVFMLITDNKGNHRKRYFTNWKKRYPETVKSLIKFYKPANVKGTSLLTYSHNDKEDNDQWIFLPALRSIKQLSSEDKHNGFMGSDFSYSDVAGRQINQDEHNFIKETDKYYLIRSIPKDNEDPYSMIDLVIKKDIFMPLKIIFYNKKGEKLKTLVNKKIERHKDTYIAIEAVMENHIKGSNTLLQVSGITLDEKISDNSFGVKSLQ